MCPNQRYNWVESSLKFIRLSLVKYACTVFKLLHGLKTRNLNIFKVINLLFRIMPTVVVLVVIEVVVSRLQ